tara:strand:+ start:190 stop:405 length:216 start_codon:yes stop_codon:yes gene_type:complete
MRDQYHLIRYDRQITDTMNLTATQAHERNAELFFTEHALMWINQDTYMAQEKELERIEANHNNTLTIQELK